MKKKKEVIDNISLLYELSLGIGSSLNLEENCACFIDKLILKTNSIRASVWLRNNVFNQDDFFNYLLVYSNPFDPSESIMIYKEDFWDLGLLQLDTISSSSNYCFLPPTKHPIEVNDKQYVIFNLRENGFIRICFPKNIEKSVLIPKLNALKDIIDKFAISLKGCIAHSRALHETQRRRLIEKEFITSNEKYESVVRSIREGLIITDLNGYIVFVNDTMCQLCGFRREEIIKTQGYKLIIPEGHWADYQQKLINRKVGQSEKYEFPIKHKDGRILWASISATPHLNSDRVIIGSLALIADITDKKAIQQEILDGQKRLQLILDTSLDAIITIDEDSFVTGWNQSAELIFGYAEEEVLGQPLHNLIIPTQMIPNHLSGMSHYMESWIDPVLNQRIELTAIRKSGEEFPVELSISPIKIQNKYFFSAFLRDITQRKKSEDALIKAKQDAEKARNVERQFLAHMSHEIRTPMNAVIGMTYLLQQSKLSSEQLEYVEALKFSADSLMALISDILDLSKIEAGELELESRSFSLHQLLNSLKKTYQFRVQEKNISVEINIDDHIQNQIIGDASRVNQILGNLLSNASKFTSDGYIGINALFVELPDKKYWIKFQVYDTGIGISKENLDLIFGSFKQATIDTHREFGGTGLGLSIVKQLVELQGGTISVESTLGEGTMFEVLLPFIDSGLANSEENQNLTQYNYASDKLKKLTVLIAEDNLINQKLIGSILTQWEVSFDLTKDGIEAVEFSKKKLYDLIFMDINMPKMNGYEAVLAIKKDSSNPNYKTPIITLTAAALYKERERMFKAGVADFITKPFSPQLLQQTIISCLDETAPPFPSKKKAPISSPIIDTQLFDISYLEKFSQGNPQFIVEMLQLFLEQNPKQIQELKKELHQKNWAKVQDIAHQMKSTLGALGMFQQQQIAKKIESEVQDENLIAAQILALVQELQQTCEMTYPLLEQELDIPKS
ncbi:MAG: PAS domain S-box protein [Aureispira sp.]|nr:PAS domain S-box protein [Aureispira sp.]